MLPIHAFVSTIPPIKPNVVVEPEGITDIPDTRGETCHDSAMEEDEVFTNERSKDNSETECPSSHIRETDSSLHSDVTSLGAAMSTLADELFPTKSLIRDFPDITSGSDVEEPAFEQKAQSSEIHQLCNISRAIINHYFQEASTIELPRGHSTIALHSEQGQSVLRVVADESARASYDMMEVIIERARRFNLGNSSTRKPSQNASFIGGSAPTFDAETNSDGETGRTGSLTRGALRTDDDSNSIGYTFERTSPSLVAVTQPPQRCEPRLTDPSSSALQQLVDSSGAQTLAALKEEALTDRQSKGRRTKPPSMPRTTRRRVTKSCQIMKEEYFEAMAWTRLFVSGTVDPKWNRYKFYCQI